MRSLRDCSSTYLFGCKEAKRCKPPYNTYRKAFYGSLWRHWWEGNEAFFTLLLISGRSYDDGKKHGGMYVCLRSTHPRFFDQHSALCNLDCSPFPSYSPRYHGRDSFHLCFLLVNIARQLLRSSLLVLRAYMIPLRQIPLASQFKPLCCFSLRFSLSIIASTGL